MKKLLLLLLLSLGLIGSSYACDIICLDKKNQSNCFESTPMTPMTITNWECNEGYIRYENRCYKEGELPQDVIEREIAEFEAELAAELGE